MEVNAKTFSLEVSKFMYKYNTSKPAIFDNYFNLITDFIHVIRDKLNLGNLLY